MPFLAVGQSDKMCIRDRTYMIGVNAVGKTTILDAIRYCLTRM